MPVRDLIRVKIEQLGLSMADLSKGAGKNHAYLQQYLERGVPKRLPEDVRAYLADRLGLDEIELRDQHKINSLPRLGGLKVPEHSSGSAQQIGTDDRIKVLGMAECGADGWALWNGEVVDHVPRPPNLQGATHAYAVYATGDSMAPRYMPGELVYIHPGKPVTPGSFVLVQMTPKQDGEPPKAILKRLARRSGNKLHLEQYNPPKTFTINAEEVVSIHRVVGSGEA